jgi:hypothetical protein
LSPGKPGVAAGSSTAMSTGPGGNRSNLLSGSVISCDILSSFFFAMGRLCRTGTDTET